MRAFYEAPSEFEPRTPDDVASIVEALASATSLDRRAREFPVERESLERAAGALEAVARAEGPPVDRADPSPAQLDRFIDARVISPALRPFFAAGLPRRLERPEEEDAYGAAVETSRIPDEPLLYYCLGAWWGEWLVRHRSAAWALEAPLTVPQWFPDGLTTMLTVCLLPFSQVAKKVADPEGDNLAFKSGLVERPVKELPPFPLIASLADARHAADALMKPSAREAIRLLEAGEDRAAFDAFLAAVEEDHENPRLLALAVQHAMTGGVFDLAERWQHTLLELVPGHPASRHNLAVIHLYTGRPAEALSVLEALVAEVPRYGRARLTLAAVLGDAGRAQDALQHLEWVTQNDRQLAGEAAEQAKRLRARQ